MADDQREGHEDDRDHLRTDPPPANPPAPDPERPAENAPSAPPSSDTHSSADDGGRGDRLDRIEGIVNGLVDIVAGLTPKDERPTKVPWTHRGGRRDEE